MSHHSVVPRALEQRLVDFSCCYITTAILCYYDDECFSMVIFITSGSLGLSQFELVDVHHCSVRLKTDIAFCFGRL